MSLKYEDVAIPENSGKVYVGRLTEDYGEHYHHMQVHDTNEGVDEDMVLYHYKEHSPKEYRENDVLEIIEECDVEDDYEDELDNEMDEIDHKAIKHLYHEEDVYLFNNKDDLLLLYKAMNEPMIDGVWGDNTYLDKLTQEVFGVVYYRTEYDDWSCGHPYSYHMKIIFGIK